LQQRLQISLEGSVQGVGFRPFIYRLANDLDLVGWVMNSAQGVAIEVEGGQTQLESFLQRLEEEAPARSQIQRLTSSFLQPIGYPAFEIRVSIDGEKTAIITPDIATCPDCLREIFDTNNRRYRYPFINCTHCGPRFSILTALPYDRPHTTMNKFEMCADCQAEYLNPRDRRFHAQPNACPRCGPHLELWDTAGNALASDYTALQMAAQAILQGKILAVKGLGGFHLIVNACNEEALQRLRQAKRREAKPFALMYPSLAFVKAHCQVSQPEEQVLRSPEAPIVLLHRKQSLPNSQTPTMAIAPGNPYLGIMLPYTPLHHLLMAELGFPVVATSGNLASEAICTTEHEAIQCLGKIADLFLIHDRPIARPVDDSIVRVVMDRPMLLRRARGYAPLSIHLSASVPPILAVGAHLKNSIALAINHQAFLSQHIGDLETVPATEAFQQTIASFQSLYEKQPTAIAYDLHPDYYSTQFAQKMSIPMIAVQHHYAHAVSCMAEHQLNGSVLAIAWDGAGYGLDGTIWGGEFLHITETSCLRVAHLQTFPLPGGSKAIQEPRRSSLGLLYKLFGDEVFEMQTLAPVQAFSHQELKILKTMLRNSLNTPVTSSVGRLFDAIASILGLHQHTQFQGQAAMALEFGSEMFETDEHFAFDILESTNPNTSLPRILDWAMMVKQVLTDRGSGLPIGKLSAKFHNTLVEMLVAVAKHVGEERVILTGGCFQNKSLTEKAVQRLRAAGFHPYWHQQIPPNDGGIALGQIVAASRQLTGEKFPCV
jgi:hydrogenase maturation protein HypF